MKKQAPFIPSGHGPILQFTGPTFGNIIPCLLSKTADYVKIKTARNHNVSNNATTFNG